MSATVIVGHDEVDPASLLANPKNWRIHPQYQQDALVGVLDEVGWVDRIKVNKRTGFVVDGHARVVLALRHGQSRVPIEHVDLTDEEEDKILATFDPISAMAVADAAQLDALLNDVSTEDAAVSQLLADLAERHGIAPPDFAPVGIDEQGRLDEKARVTCPECGHEFAP